MIVFCDLAKMATMGFSVESMIRGYHEYKSIWENPSIDESLICEREIGNCHDTHAVAIKKTIEGDIKTVGHVPRSISAICSIFIRRGGSIVCLVNGSRRYSSNLPQGGLEIPCILKFVARNLNEVGKTRRQLESTLHTCTSLCTGTTMPSSEVIVSMVSSQLQSKAQFSSSTPVDSDVPFDPPMLKIDDHLSDSSVDITESCSVDYKPPAKKQKIFDSEKIIMGEELSDVEINYAQQLLKEKHPNINGLRTTLYKGKIPEIENSVQIVHCLARHHWITVSTIDCMDVEVRVFDSLFTNCDKETEAVIRGLYQRETENIRIIMSRCQKQTSGSDCGLFAIAFAMALVFNEHPSKLKFNQQKMRSHLVECFTKQEMTPFPCRRK